MSVARGRMRGAAWLAGAVLATVLLPCAPLTAQGGPILSAGVSFESARLVRDLAPDTPLTGLTAQLDARVGFSRVALEVQYAQGTLSPGAGAASAEDLVDGEVRIALRALSWLTLSAGPHLRAFLTPTGTERWTRIEGRLALRGEVVPGVVEAEADVWHAFSSEVNLPDGASGARGARIGLVIDLARSPLALRVFYRVDRAQLMNERAQVLEGVGLGVSLTRD